MKSEAEQRDAFSAVLKNLGAFTQADLQVMRESAPHAGAWGGIGANALNFRMEVELIDSIRNLNATSTFLSKVGISVAVVGVILTITQIVLKYL